MVEKKSEKTNKNLYLPNWIIEMLDAEGTQYGGPGVVASASILMFHDLPAEAKMAVLRAYRTREIRSAYATPDMSTQGLAATEPEEAEFRRQLSRILDAAQAIPAEKKSSKAARHSKAG